MISQPVDAPSQTTLFRTRIADDQSHEQVRRLAKKLKPLLWMRDAKQVRQINQAATPEELLDLADQTQGLGVIAWIDRAQAFGPDMHRLTIERLVRLGQVPHSNERRLLYELLFASLRWQGEIGAALIDRHFQELDEQGKSLACVVLGILGAHDSAEMIWSHYLAVRSSENPELILGALWGLVDLQDRRVDEALSEWLVGPKPFFELYGFLARAGDIRCAPPLLERVTSLKEAELEEAMWALVAIAHRIGRENLAGAIQNATEPGAELSEYQELADYVLAQSENDAQAYFSMFFRGFRPEDLAAFPVGEDDSD